MKIFNTAQKKLVDFKPLEEGKVSMYVCGPTVYDNAHLGHGRSASAFDLMRRYFLYKGFQVLYVSNYTDIDDKMITRAAEEGITVPELADKVIPEYEKDYGAINIMKPDVQPLATDHIGEMISLIEKLEENGHIYVLKDGVYFDVRSYSDYGSLSGQNLDDLQVGARIEIRSDKKNPQDFVLWKFKKEGEPFWESPWGEGRPGWHIECSAMTWKHLGEKFDIHGGGLDLTFPHHECEVAQSICSFGKGSFAQYWLHNGFIQVDNEKMSKSLGNFFTLKEIFEKFNPAVVRFMFLQTHYRNPVNFSDVLLTQAEAGLNRLRSFVRNVEHSLDNNELAETCSLKDRSSKMIKSFESFMDNDFDTSGALGAVFELVKDVNVALAEKGASREGLDSVIESLRNIDTVFAVIFEEDEIELDSALIDLIKAREEARAKRDFERSDAIRDELLSKGIELEDTANGTIWKKTS